MKRRGTAELRHEVHRSFDDGKKQYNGRHALLAVLHVKWVGVASVRRGLGAKHLAGVLSPRVGKRKLGL